MNIDDYVFVVLCLMAIGTQGYLIFLVREILKEMKSGKNSKKTHKVKPGLVYNLDYS